MKSLEKLEKLAVITSGIRLWTGETTLKPEDFHLGEGGSLPDEQVASLGRLSIIDKQAMTKIEKGKNAFNYLMERNAVPFLGGYAVSIEQFRSIKPDLDAAVASIRDAIDDFVNNYDRVLTEWKEKNPLYAASIERDALTANQVRSRFDAFYTVTKVAPLDAEEEAQVAQAVEGLYGKLVHEINLNAKQQLKKYLDKKDQKFRQSVKDVLASLKQKLYSLSFINPRLTTFIDSVDKIIAALPLKGRIEGAHYFLVIAFFQLMSDKEQLYELLDGKVQLDAFIQNVISMHQPSPVVSSLTAVSQDHNHVEDSAVTVSKDDQMALFFDEEPVSANAPAETSVSAEADVQTETAASEIPAASIPMVVNVMEEDEEAPAEAVEGVKPEPAQEEPEAEPEPLENWWF
jgi:hypothetical protein